MIEKNLIQKEEQLSHLVDAIGEIKAELKDGVIKEYEIPRIMNTKTMKEVGFGVRLQLNTRYVYTDKILNQWKKKLKAEGWIIEVQLNQLLVTFTVRFKKD